MEGDGSSASASFHGFVAGQYDAALLVTAARLGFIPRFRRRLDVVEQRAFIHSGSVFLWNEEESYMKRWTDGYPWSPSRVQNKFLVYREMVKRGGARSRTAARLLGHASESSADPPQRKYIRNLASSLFNRGELELLELYSNSGYPRSDDIFKRGGLVKKTFTITLPKETWHVVAYYTLEDVLNDRFATPSESPALHHPRILSDVTDVLDSSSRALFETTAALHIQTPLPWTTPFLEFAGTEKKIDYHSGIPDLGAPVPQQSSPSSSSSSSSSSPLATFPPPSTISTPPTPSDIIELKPDISIMSSSSSSSDSISLHSNSSSSPYYHHHYYHHTLNDDPNLDTMYSLPPSPVVVFSHSPSFSEYSDFVEEVYVDVRDYSIHGQSNYYAERTVYSTTYC